MKKELLEKVFEEGHSHFQEMSGGKINATELVASLICKKERLWKESVMRRKL